jgi:molybdopterin synthase catalytic subunit
LEGAELRYGIVSGPIDVALVRQQVEDPSHGAILVFEGVARDNFDGRAVQALEYQAYPAMAVPVLEAIGAEVHDRWPKVALSVVHRTGRLKIGETSLVIAVGSAHRPEVYEASRYALEALKERLPVWKKEIYQDGEAWKPNAG